MTMQIDVIITGHVHFHSAELVLAAFLFVVFVPSVVLVSLLGKLNKIYCIAGNFRW